MAPAEANVGAQPLPVLRFLDYKARHCSRPRHTQSCPVLYRTGLLIVCMQHLRQAQHGGSESANPHGGGPHLGRGSDEAHAEHDGDDRGPHAAGDGNSQRTTGPSRGVCEALAAKHGGPLTRYFLAGQPGPRGDGDFLQGQEGSFGRGPGRADGDRQALDREGNRGGSAGSLGQGLPEVAPTGLQGQHQGIQGWLRLASRPSRNSQSTSSSTPAQLLGRGPPLGTLRPRRQERALPGRGAGAAQPLLGADQSELAARGPDVDQPVPVELHYVPADQGNAHRGAGDGSRASKHGRRPGSSNREPSHFLFGLS